MPTEKYHKIIIYLFIVIVVIYYDAAAESSVVISLSITFVIYDKGGEITATLLAVNVYPASHDFKTPILKSFQQMYN